MQSSSNGGLFYFSKAWIESVKAQVFEQILLSLLNCFQQKQAVHVI